ncbi:MAG: YceD family protein [Rhizobiaceae bacterium]
MNNHLLTKKVKLYGLPNSGKVVDLKADNAILEAIANITDADEVLDFEANLLVKPWNANGASVTGKIRTQIRQTCVVSLEEMENWLEFTVSRYFLPDNDPVFSNQLYQEGELMVDPEADDLPDHLEDSSIDIWAVLIEEMNLHIDPFPKLEKLDNVKSSEKESQPGTRKPFAGLKALITEKKSRK